ncbi:MAG: Gfo/Idh/MocA family oxidoreductase [Phycisphaerales bacterium]|nr:MAG: Gfo/Idh/MocA family oxidoreductase [Phycisphaerales bacterium]
MIRWGIIGCGDVTEVKSGPGFQNANGSTLVAVMRRDADRAADYARRHKVAKWYSDANALIADEDVDAVSIATPPSRHCELALGVAAAGKAALVEKPMARNHDECLQMVEAFKAANVPLFVSYYRRALPKFLKVKSLIDDGAIGEVLTVSATLRCQPGRYDRDNLPWRLRYEVSGGGLFVDLACHTLDYLDFLFGPIVEVSGHAGNQGGAYDVEDAVVMCFVHESGVQGTGAWHFNCRRTVDDITIVGTAGTISLPTFANRPIRLVRRYRTTRYRISNPRAIQQPLIQAVVDELESRGTCPSTGFSAARTSWVMDQVLEPYYGKRAG